MPAASSSASSTVRLPSYSRQASVTVARWIFDRSICLNIVETSLFVNRYTFNAYRLTIFQYFRHAEEAVSLVRRVGQRPLLCERRLHCVLAKHVLSRQNGRGRLHAFDLFLPDLHKSQPLINSCHCERRRGGGATPPPRRTGS